MSDTEPMQKRKGPLCWVGTIIVYSVFPFYLFSQNQGAPSSSPDSLPGPSSTSGVVLVQSFPGPYTLVERSNWARYDNGKYTGHVYRETRYRLDPFQEREGVRYRGTVYVFEETLRDLQKVARPLDDIIPVEFILSKTGSIRLVDDRGYPLLRNFPVFPEKALRPGDIWIAAGERIVDPRNDGNQVKLPILAEYRFLGEEPYKGEQVYRIQAQYATRYKTATSRGSKTDQKTMGSGSSQTNQPGVGQEASGPFIEASGTHVVDILIRVADGRLVLMRDTLDETFLWPDGSSVRYKGFTLTFSESFLPFDRSAVLAQVARQLGAPEGLPGGGGKAGGADSTGTAGGGAPGGGGSDLADRRSSPGAGPGAPGAAGIGADDKRSPPASGGMASPAGKAEPSGGEKGEVPEGIALRSGSDGVTVDGAFQLDEGRGSPGASSDRPATVDLPVQNIEVAAVPEGVKLTVRDIRFVADSDEILSSERGRLDLIARAIQAVLGSSPNQPLILVEGHTAAVGRPAAEQELSVRRAKKIVDELTARGIPAERFIYKGWGSTRPLADNRTEAGKAKNRRVEITILQ
ncbi:MAG: OmpA family protein [Treponemataceae bacterium]|nr:OmpA family protein [Treponemataceae bacterium]